MLKDIIKRALAILVNPEKGFKKSESRSLEQVTGDYLKLLLAVGLLAGVVRLLYAIGRAVYLEIFLDVEIQYWRMLNYSLGQATSMLFFYVFAGTFLLVSVAFILRLFTPRVRFFDLLKIVLLSMSPVLLFSWIPLLPFALFIWAAFLFVIGVRHHRSIEVRKDSIKQRD